MQGLGRERDQNRLIRILAAATFLIFFESYMVAPLIPHLSHVFGESHERVGLIVPAYLIPYGVSVLFYGLLSDRIGRRRIILTSMAAFSVLTALTAVSQSFGQLLGFRLVTGFATSGVVPMGLALIGQTYPFEKRGRPLGLMFGAMAGGMAFGSTFGALGQAWMDWRWVFITVGIAGLGIFLTLYKQRSLLGEAPKAKTVHFAGLMQSYKALLASDRGRITYPYVFLNALFHSGVYTWLGVYLKERFDLSEAGVGLALLGYGVPGFVFGPIIGKVADRYGRRWLIPGGLMIGALSAGILGANISLIGAALIIGLLSLGYDMTQPLLAGIVTSIDPKRSGQAMGLNVFLLFTGFGVGSVLFGRFLIAGFSQVFLFASIVQLILGLTAVRSFRDSVKANLN